MKWLYLLLWCALLLLVLAEDAAKDDGIPKNEVSPLAYLNKPKIGM
jgi:hypothetical protein